MSPSPERPLADRNLLFGILALQMHFVSRDALVAAMNAWILDKDRPLGQVLLQQGALTDPQLQALDSLLSQHVAHHGSAERSLQSLSVEFEALPLLISIGDDDLQASLTTLRHRVGFERPSGNSGFPRDSGRYRVLRPHARGGLGEVFVAEDTELHREVALKEIQPHRADDPGSRRRFVLEAEVTGGLEHPGIVPVYGLGIRSDGRPYYAMRFIRGKSFREAIDGFHAEEKPGRDPRERGLAFRQLLRRFIDVCNVIAYAHSRGVLHRDLKPANVMLGSFGETLLVDWGLAKASVGPHSAGDPENEVTVDPPLRPASGSDRAATEVGVVLGTPAFMSPEQAAGQIDEMGPASDICSLGAMLYVLLTGKKPYTGADAREVAEQVKQGRFAPPRQVKPDTPPALDAICRKAMALRPADRYATALDLAVDVEHWLADEPIAICRDPWTLRLSRWARRHRTGVVAAAVFLVSAVVALSVSTALIWQEKQKTADQKRLAEENYRLARDMGFESIRLIKSAEAFIAADPRLDATRRELLVASARAFRQYLEQDPDDVELQQRTAEIYRYTANVLRQTKEAGEAEPLYRDAIGLLEGLAEEQAQEPDHARKLAETLRDYGAFLLKRGRLQEADDTLRRAIVVHENFQAAAPDLSGTAQILGIVLLELSEVENLRGKIPASGKTAAKAAGLFRARVQFSADKGEPLDPLFLARALDQVAMTEREQNRLEPALSGHTRAISILARMLEKPGARVNRNDVLHVMAQCTLEQARTLAKSRESLATAEKKLSQTARQWELLGKANAKMLAYREWRAIAYQARGQVRVTMNKIAEARADLDLSRKILEELVQEMPAVYSYQGTLGRTYLELGWVAQRGGDKEGAAAWFKKAVASLRKSLELAPEIARNQQSLEQALAEGFK